MGWHVDGAKEIAGERLGGLAHRWAHVQAVGTLAESLMASCPAFDEVVSVAAWLHDVGYAPTVVRTGFHPLDGALFLAELGVPPEVVALVAHHTGASSEAEERGLVDELRALPVPTREHLDALTLVDLVVGPTGALTVPRDRLAEVLRRYGPDDEVHRAVSRSRPALLLSAARARTALGLPDEWPLVPAQRVVEA